MRTTIISIKDHLKARVAVAAERAGKTAHDFILGAIAQKAEQAAATPELDKKLPRETRVRLARSYIEAPPLLAASE